MFLDRRDAGRQLAKELLKGHIAADLIVGLVHGGVVISFELHKALHIPHTALLVKKIGSPGNPEYALGARVPEGQQIDVTGKQVLLTDDGAATGETMKAAVQWTKNHGATSIMVALPVAPPDVADELRTMVTNLFVLDTPADFGAVGEFYENFPQLTDQDVVELLA